MYSTIIALLFLLKIRLGARSVVQFVTLRYGDDGRKLYWRYESLKKKHLKAKLDLDFLIKCKTYKVIPKFLRFKLYRKSLKSSNFYRSWQDKLLNYEIKFKEGTIKSLCEELSVTDTLITNKFSSIDSIIVRRNVRQILCTFETTTNATHVRKLKDLGINNELAPCNPQSVVFNFSSVTLSRKLETLLAFGLDFCLPIYKLNFVHYFSRFESLAGRLGKLDHNRAQMPEFMNKLHALTFKYFYNFKSHNVFSAIFTKSDISLLKSFASNDQVIVCKPDKGRGVVILDRDVYTSKMINFLSDNCKFQTITDPIDKYTRKIEDKLNNFLRKIKNSTTISEEILKTLFASGSAPGILYGLPKIHKPDFKTKFQFRPIFAAYNNPCFKLAKFIVSVLTPYINNDYSVLNSTSFISDLKQFSNVSPNANSLFMTSYDVQDLYTNVPLKETINIIVNLIFQNATDSFLGLSKKLFTNLLEICTLNSFFIFNRVLYKQCDGLGMGLPQSPAFANIFLAHHEAILLENCPIQFKPLFYRRYMDDTFVIFSKQSHAALFLDYINGHHDNLSFTMETETNRTLSFLDVKISIDCNNNFSTSVFRKSTFSGLGISYFSYCTDKFKINSIKTLLHRAFNICSNYVLLDNELQFLTSFFINNGFSRIFIQSKIGNFLNNKLVGSQNNNPVNEKTNVYFSLHYFGYQSEKMKKELLTLLNRYFVQYKFHVILVNNFKIGSLFKYKDTLSKGMRSEVIYKYCCPSCGSCYARLPGSGALIAS